MPTHGNCICSDFAPDHRARVTPDGIHERGTDLSRSRCNRGEDTKRKFTHFKRQRLISANGPAAAGTDLDRASATPPSGLRDGLPKHGCRADPNWDIQPCRRRDDGWNGSTCLMKSKNSNASYFAILKTQWRAARFGNCRNGSVTGESARWRI